MELNCQTCDEHLKRERGCNEKGILPFYVLDERYFRCPLKLVTATSWEYIKAYRYYKEGFLPNGKSWLDECSKVLDAFSIIGKEISAIEQEQVENQKRKKR